MASRIALDPTALAQLRQALMAAPIGSWRGLGCDLGLLVTTLQASEQVLRSAGQHHAAAELQALLREFLSRQQQLRRLQGQGAGGQSPLMPLQRPPVRKRRQRPGRRIPSAPSDVWLQ